VESQGGGVVDEQTTKIFEKGRKRSNNAITDLDQRQAFWGKESVEG